MAVICDGCGTKKGVRRAFITVWNGNIIDLCRKCSRKPAKNRSIVQLIDNFAGYTDQQDVVHKR